MMEWKLLRWEQNIADFWDIRHRNWDIMTILQQKYSPTYIAALKAMSVECSEQKIQELLELVELQKDKKKSLELFQGECSKSRNSPGITQ